MTTLAIPPVSQLARHVSPLAAHILTGEVLTLFKRQFDLLCMPIFDGESFRGVVTRKHLFQLLVRPFGMDLYARKPSAVIP